MRAPVPPVICGQLSGGTGEARILPGQQRAQGYLVIVAILAALAAFPIGSDGVHDSEGFGGCATSERSIGKGIAARRASKPLMVAWIMPVRPR
jgi:hypothetical protein